MLKSFFRPGTTAVAHLEQKVATTTEVCALVPTPWAGNALQLEDLIWAFFKTLQI